MSFYFSANNSGENVPNHAPQNLVGGESEGKSFVNKYRRLFVVF